jgi:hypothetical protein
MSQKSFEPTVKQSKGGISEAAIHNDFIANHSDSNRDGVIPAFTVGNTNDAGAGSLRQAIIDANASGGGVIDFDEAATGAIALQTALPDISGNIAINGPGHERLTLQRSDAKETGDFRIFTIERGCIAAISGLEIKNGRADLLGGGIFNSGVLRLSDCVIAENHASMNGGGIFNNGFLSLEDCAVSKNFAGFLGGGIFNLSDGDLRLDSCAISGNNASLDGGGIVNAGAATLSRCAVTDNSAARGVGGGFYGNSGALSLGNCTIANNSAPSGGGIFNFGDLVLSNCTVANNSTFGGPGGGVLNQGEMKLISAIIAKNSGLHADVSGIVISKGRNLIGDSTGSSGWISNQQDADCDLLDTDPLLDPEGHKDNGGPTVTIALLPGSPAIKAGARIDASGNPVAADQRGVPRALNESADATAPCDIGAYEASTSQSHTA